MVAALVLTACSASYAGWRVKQATDPTGIEPVAIPESIELRSGDIILAGGVSLQSRLVRSLTDGNRFSHIGILHPTPEGLFVIHAAPHGPGDGGLGERVAMIPLSLFLSERGYVAVQVMRLRDESARGLEAAADACERAVHYAELAVPFDHEFDLSDEQSIYCSELVYLAYKQAGQAWPDTLVGEYDNLIVQGPGITPGAFETCSDLMTVWKQPTKGTP